MVALVFHSTLATTSLTQESFVPQLPSERRQSPRHRVVIPVEISTHTSLSLYACENLSRGGTYLRQAIPLGVGTPVGVRLTIPGEYQAIHCKGVIANVPDATDYGMGVRFIGLSAEEEGRIANFAARFDEHRAEQR
jgi:uncharacterized protein (TIGR02266 family)